MTMCSNFLLLIDILYIPLDNIRIVGIGLEQACNGG